MGFITNVTNAASERLRKGVKVGWTFHFGWTGGRVQTYTYFSPEEIKGLDAELCAMLDIARARAGVPFTIVSGLRTPQTNLTCGGVGHSTHCTGLGVDLGLSGFAEGGERDHARAVIRKGLIAAGFTRFGTYPNHIHADIGKAPDYVQDVEWFSTNEG